MVKEGGKKSFVVEGKISLFKDLIYPEMWNNEALFCLVKG